MKKTYILLIVLFLIAATLRFYKLGVIPAGLHRDEAFLGYNAYSILKTGKDMSGNFLPLHLKSFIYSPAGYSYFSLPPIAVFGLNQFSIRFASAFFGSLTAVALYFLVLELYKSNTVALFSSLFIALSPWHVNLSRTATENIIVTFFIMLGIVLYLKKYIVLSYLSFAITLATYQGPRAFLPLFIPILLILFPVKKTGTTIALFSVLILIPILVILLNPNLALRIRTVSLFADQKTQLTIDENIREDGVTGVTRLLTRLYHNKFTSYADQFIKNYFSHFTYDFLFTDKSLPERYKVPIHGLLYIVQLPLLILGLLTLVKKSTITGKLLIGWLLIAPIGSALTFDDIPNLQRTVLVVPVLSIVSAIGFLQLKKPFFLIAIMITLLNITFYTHQYFVHQPVHEPWFRHEGYKELVKSINLARSPNEKVVITNRESAPAIFFLFFNSYNPSLYLTETMGKAIHDYDRADFGPYQFSQEECPLKIDPTIGSVIGQTNTLYVNYGTCDTPEGIKELFVIRRGDKSKIFTVVTL